MDRFIGDLKGIVQPWYDSLMDTKKAQTETLERLTEGYSKTGYGSRFCSGSISDIREYQRAFPTVNYEGLRPFIEKVKNGDHKELLSEPVVKWAMTRGTTGIPKLIPATRTHLREILAGGARGLVNYALRNRDYEVLSGGVLNLNFPSKVESEETRAGRIEYGFSSGTYAKYNPRLGRVGLVPIQEEIDSLGSGIRKEDWERRFELVYERARESEIKALMGVTNVITAFGRYLKKRHGVLPKDLWKIKAAFCTSLPKIHTYHAPQIRRLYGNANIVEMYTATEGVFAQQIDGNPYVVPNYDLYLFEVKMGDKLKMLYELRRGEWGRVIVSSCLFPRYDIGDYIECAGKNYFRVFGRTTWRSYLEHFLFNIFTGRVIRA
ncbi:MAG: GH3 auxin-responsive promoter family protein [Candidatus Verstraetearchaeota archaeon]|nr:GH3 auxin-responsive promoter family protein [Candidatus Verstraetearchaeota archaeon]